MTIPSVQELYYMLEEKRNEVFSLYRRIDSLKETIEHLGRRLEEKDAKINRLESKLNHTVF